LHPLLARLSSTCLRAWTHRRALPTPDEQIMFRRCLPGMHVAHRRFNAIVSGNILQGKGIGYTHPLIECFFELTQGWNFSWGTIHDCAMHYFTEIKTLVLKLAPEASQALAVIRRWKLNDPKVMDASMLAPVPIALATPST